MIGSYMRASRVVLERYHTWPLMDAYCKVACCETRPGLAVWQPLSPDRTQSSYNTSQENAHEIALQVPN